MATRVAHRLARTNYLTRTLSFAFSFIVVLAVMEERGFSAGTLALGFVTLLAYPQLAYLYARQATDSKRAEFHNLNADAVLMGLWAAQLHFALWPVCGALVGISLNNAVCGGMRRFLLGSLYWCAAAAVWALVRQYPPDIYSGPLVSGLCFAGILGYVTALGLLFHTQNSRLLMTRDVLQTSNEQFCFIAESAGDLVVVLDPEYHITYASQSHAKHFDPEHFAEGREWLGLIHPDDIGLAKIFLDSLRQSVGQEHMKLRMLPSRGFPFAVECQGNPGRKPGGELQMIVLVCRNLTAPVIPDSGPAPVRP